MSINEFLDEVEVKRSAVSQAEGELEDLLDKLADVASKYYGENKFGTAWRHPKCCSGASFVFYGVITETHKEGQLPFGDSAFLSFGTECSWCGTDSGAGLKVPISYAEEHLQD
jgi:hypothetical protein